MTRRASGQPRSVRAFCTSWNRGDGVGGGPLKAAAGPAGPAGPLGCGGACSGPFGPGGDVNPGCGIGWTGAACLGGSFLMPGVKSGAFFFSNGCCSVALWAGVASKLFAAGGGPPGGGPPGGPLGGIGPGPGAVNVLLGPGGGVGFCAF